MTEAITSHYSFGGLRERIEQGLAQLDGPPTIAALGAVDEFHVGGRPATKHLVEQLALTAQDRVIDVGSGLGGLARYIAGTTGAAVTGVDLTAEYVNVAEWLSGLVGLDDKVSFINGSASALPKNSFTAATMVHVGMNIADKTVAFREVASVLNPGAHFAIYDILRTGDGDPEYPCPWAQSASTSFLETADDYVAHLAAAGFSVASVQDRTDAALASFEQLVANSASGPPPLGLHLVMGPTTPTKVANMVAAVRGRVLAPTELIATRN